MDVTTQEIWQAARRLVRTPLFTLTAALTLALAIAANASIFTVVNRVVVNPLPYPKSDRLIALDYGIPAQKVASGMNSMAWQLYFQLADHARTLQNVAVYDTDAGTLTGGGTPERVQIVLATPSLAPSSACNRQVADGSSNRKASRAPPRSRSCRTGCGYGDSAPIEASSAARSPSTVCRRRSSA